MRHDRRNFFVIICTRHCLFEPARANPVTISPLTTLSWFFPLWLHFSFRFIFAFIILGRTYCFRNWRRYQKWRLSSRIFASFTTLKSKKKLKQSFVETFARSIFFNFSFKMCKYLMIIFFLVNFSIFTENVRSKCNWIIGIFLIILYFSSIWICIIFSINLI